MSQLQLFETFEDLPGIDYEEGDILLDGSLALAGFNWKSYKGEIFDPKNDFSDRLDNDIEVYFHGKELEIGENIIGFSEAEMEKMYNEHETEERALQQLVVEAVTRYKENLVG